MSYRFLAVVMAVSAITFGTVIGYVLGQQVDGLLAKVAIGSAGGLFPGLAGGELAAQMWFRGERK